MARSIRASSQAYDASNTTITCTTPTGTVSGDVLLAFVLVDNIGTITATGWTTIQNGAGGAGQMNHGAFYIDLAVSPDANYTFTNSGSAGNMEVVLVAVDKGGDTLDAITGTLSATNTTATGTTASLTGAADPTLVLCAFGSDDNNTIATPPSGMSSVQTVDGSALELAVYSQSNIGAAAFTKSIVWNTSTDTIQSAVLMDWTAGVSGPTVTVQPTAQTARVNGESAATATFACTATGTGTVDLVAEIEDSVGAGTYSTLANGSGATWSGLTGTGSASASVSLVGTFTAETHTGKRIRIRADDDNGMTYSDAVVLTVYTGPVLSTASGTGAGTIDLSADEVLGNGYSYRVTVTPTGTPAAAKRSHGRGV